MMGFGWELPLASKLEWCGDRQQRQHRDRGGQRLLPPEALDQACFQPSDHRSVCGWKGEAHYYNVVVQGAVNANAAWYYPDPKEAAQQIKGRVAFWKGVRVA